MLGAIIGDIVGSRFEWHNHKSKEFELFTSRCSPTDDSVMSLAVAKAILESQSDYSDLSSNAIKYMQLIGRLYPYCGFGGHFREWIQLDNPQPYRSYGNGAAMRISAVGFAGKNIEEVKRMSKLVTQISHNHPESFKGAEATAVCIFLARTGSSKEDIKDYVLNHYYSIDFTLDEIRDSYIFDVSCQGSVPQALEAFFESNSFEDAVRNAISIGGDSDTIGAICGGIAEAYYGIPDDIREKALCYLDPRLTDILNEFESKY